MWPSAEPFTATATTDDGNDVSGTIDSNANGDDNASDLPSKCDCVGAVNINNPSSDEDCMDEDDINHFQDSDPGVYMVLDKDLIEYKVAGEQDRKYTTEGLLYTNRATFPFSTLTVQVNCLS